MISNRTSPASRISNTAHHEAGHAVASVLAFRNVQWPQPKPPLPVKYIEIIEEAPGYWFGHCYGPSVYSVEWPNHLRIANQWRDAMEWQIVVYLAGGIAEAIHRGERRKREVSSFAAFNCGSSDDFESSFAVLTDLRKLTGRQYGEQRFAERALALLLAHWPAVEALATALIEERVRWRAIPSAGGGRGYESKRINGDRVERIITEAI